MTLRTFPLVKIFLMASLSFLIIISCKDESPNEPLEQNFLDYYPDGIGSTFEYSITEKDSNGATIQTGRRNINYTGTYFYNGINYTTQHDSLAFDSSNSVSNYLFRKSDTGVYYAVDTSQISQLIPDTLKQFVTLRNEMQLLFYSLTTGSSWSLYRITAQIQPNVEIKILDIIASFEGVEEIELIIDSTRIVYPSKKVSYRVEAYSTIGSPPEIYTSYMWYVANIGLVKFEGNQFIISTSGGGISFEVSQNILSQELIDYNIIN